jgi:hypothetical protein
MGKQRFVLVVVGAHLLVMLILFGSIVLETFMVYPNIFHDPPVSLATAQPRSAGVLLPGRLHRR